MSGFLYFLPDGPAIVDSLNAWGLGHTGKKLSARQVRTPMGEGTLVTSFDDRGSAKYDEAAQVWRKIPDRFTIKPAWCGYWIDNPPTVDDLARPQQLEGEAVELLNGEKWIVPRLRKYLQDDSPGLTYAPGLPTVLDFDDEGRLVMGEVAPQYQAIWQMGLKVGDQLMFGASDDGQGKLTWSEILEFCGPLLGINYRVSIFEVIMLGLLSERIGVKIVRAALDLDGMQERLKNLLSRSDLSGTDSASGGDQPSQETEATTGQPSVI